MAIIYKITNTHNNKVYIGFTIHTAENRWKRHCKEAKRNLTKNMPILASIRKYGESSFELDVLFEHDDAEFVLRNMEPYYIHKYKSHVSTGLGYNATYGGRGSVGLKHKESTKKMISEKAIGRKHTKLTKAKMSTSHTGTKFSKKHRKNLSKSAEGRNHTESTKNKLRIINEKFLYEIKYPNGKTITTKNLNQWCKNNNINQSNMAHVVSGKYKQHKGYKVKKIENAILFPTNNNQNICLDIIRGISLDEIRKYHNKYQYVIFSDEWKEKPEVIQSFLEYSPQKRIFARKTTVRQIDNKIAKSFVCQNHIQNIKLCKLAYGLYYKKQLVMVMLFSSHHRTPTNNEIVLQRMCSKINTQVIGGASKLLKYAISQNPNWEKIISWSDNRISRGNVYKKIGFLQEANLKSDYSYYCPKTKQRYNKQKFMKSNIECSPNQTEAERMDELGYKRVYDLGKTRWVMNFS